MSGRALPVLDMLPPSAGAGAASGRCRSRALAEFVTEAVTQPRFHVWTLGCQMNHSDSEEMAGALLAAGCAEAAALEAADLIVINSCAIREAAEQKVIGRMGALARLQGSEPGPAGRAHRLLRAGRQRRPSCGGATRRSTCSCGRTRSPS